MTASSVYIYGNSDKKPNPALKWTVLGVFTLHMGLVYWLYQTHMVIPSTQEALDHPMVINMTRTVRDPPPLKPVTLKQTITPHVPPQVTDIDLPKPLPVNPEIKSVLKPPTLITDPAPPPPVEHVISRPSWESVPNGDQFAQYYPDRAARLGKEGTVRLDCNVTAAGALTQCRVASEAPPEYGFADATLKIARFFRMKPQQEDGKPVEGGNVSLAVTWKLPQ